MLLGEGAWSSDALRQGVRAILPADASAAEILAAIEAAAAGLAVVDPRDLEALMSAAAAGGGECHAADRARTRSAAHAGRRGGE